MALIDIADKKFIVLLIVVFLLLVFSDIVAPSLTPTWYTIDTFLAFFCLIAIAFSIIPESHPLLIKMRSAVTQFYAYGSMDNPFTRFTGNSLTRLKITIGIGVLFSIIFLLPKFLGVFDLSLVLPATASVTTADTGILISTIFVVTFIQPILEETFRAGILDKTIAGWTVTYLGLGIIMILIGALLMFFLYSIALYIGFIIFIAGIVFTLYTKDKAIRWNTQPGLVNKQIGLIFAALIFGGLHAYSYASVPNFQTAFTGIVLFGLIMSEVNYIMNSLMPSLVIHSIYNGVTIAGTSMPLLFVGLSISGLLIFILYFIYQYGNFGRR